MRYYELSGSRWVPRFDDVPASALSFLDEQTRLLADIANQLRELNDKQPAVRARPEDPEAQSE